MTSRRRLAPPRLCLAACKQSKHMCMFTHTVACPLISQGSEHGCSPAAAVGAARRKPLSHDTDPGARRRWSKINVLPIPEMPLFKSQRRGEEKG